MRGFLGENDMVAYLAMMAARLIELHRVLKDTGSLYLHCDPTASHYLKMLLDGVFGFRGYRSEISWKRSSAHSDAKQGRSQYGNIRDTIFFYTKSTDWTWNWQFTDYDESYVSSAYRHSDPDGRTYRRDNLTAAKPGGDVSYKWPVKRPTDGAWEADLSAEFEHPQEGWEYKQVPPYKNRFWAYSKENMRKFATENRLAYAASGMPEYKRYLDEMPGVPLQNSWHDIPPTAGKERLGYPTQKPLALLERIIAASSNEGDVVLDPFCGCGTALDAAEKLGRQWIGIDVTHLAINLIEQRLTDAHPDAAFEVVGRPESLAGAEELARRDKHEFEKWIVPKLDGHLFEGGRKGADGGIDGFIYFKPDGKKTEKAILSVKGGENVGVGMIRDLHSTMEREKASASVFVTKALPTKPMLNEAAKVGLFESEVTGRKHPRLQILTLAEIFADKRPDLPWIVSPYKKAQRSQKPDRQAQLL
ncbi:MAG: DNA methyltransferase [Erythrobacter sp.]